MKALIKAFNWLFKESKEEILKEIKEIEDLIKKKKKKLSGKSKKSNKIVGWLFEENKEDIKKEIEEAEELIKQKKKRISELKGKKQSIAAPVATIVIITLISVLLIIFGAEKPFQEGTPYEEYLNAPFEYSCDNPNPCEECPVVVSCIQFEEISEIEGIAHFRISNNEDKSAKCKAEITMILEEEVVMDKTYSAGDFDALETKKFKVDIVSVALESHTSRRKVHYFRLDKCDNVDPIIKALEKAGHKVISVME